MFRFFLILIIKPLESKLWRHYFVVGLLWEIVSTKLKLVALQVIRST